MGLYLEEFEIGKTLHERAAAPSARVDISVFAGLVGDYNPLHVRRRVLQDDTISGGTHRARARSPWSMGDRPDLAAQPDRRPPALGLLNLKLGFSRPGDDRRHDLGRAPTATEKADLEQARAAAC